jgi:hypothetical protein
MIKYISGILMGVSIAAPSFSMTCYLAIAKDSCWTGYNVDVTVIDAATRQGVASMTVPKNIPWVRVKFPCQAGQIFALQAQYSPVIWQGTENVMYSARNYWQLNQAEAGVTAQSLNLCYGRDFSEVPIPLQASGQCSCDMQSIPAVKL